MGGLCKGRFIIAVYLGVDVLSYKVMEGWACLSLAVE